MAWNKGPIQIGGFDKGPIQVPLPPVDTTPVGTWSAVVNFDQDDTLRVEIIGPIVGEAKVSISMEVE